MKVLVFDTETTGLPTERNAPITATHKYPYILQLSYVLYDTVERRTLAVRDDYVRVAAQVPISASSTAIHGIDRTVCEQRGVPIEEALERFRAHVASADVLVAHNLQFDERMIEVECLRSQLASPFFQKPLKCTMLTNVNVCKLAHATFRGGNNYKWPTLAELHQHCFQTVPVGLHNALTDVRACLRCFVWLEEGYDVEAAEQAEQAP
jgi:DNA polymerase III epsilon subunit-like protein